MPIVLVTMPFGEDRLDRLRAVSPDLVVTGGDPATAGTSRAPPASDGRSSTWRG